MYKCDMSKPEIDNETLPPEVPPMEEQQKKYNIWDNIKYYW